MNEEHKKIWSAYIKAKQQFTQRLSQPIIIKKGSLKLRAGYLTAEIEQQKNENELLSIIKKTFDIPETDIRLDKGYFLMPNDKEISEAQFQKFRDETDRFYLDFEPKPALEGTIKTNEISKFYQELEKLGIDTKVDREGKITCTKEQILSLKELTKDLATIENMGCVYSFEPTGKFADISYFLYKKGDKTLIEVKQINNQIFKISYNHKGATIPFNLLNRLVVFFNLNLSKINSKFEIQELSNDIIQSVEDKFEQKIQIQKQNDTLEVLISSKDDFADIFDALYIEFSQIDKNVKLICSDIYFESNKELLNNFDFDLKLFSESKIQNIQSELPYPEYQVSSSNQTISFDFQNFEEFEEKKTKILAIKGLKISDYRENHKFKVKLNFINPFQEIQEKLIRKFPSIHCKVNRKNDKLKITYHYKYEPNSGKNVLNFKNFIEQECEKHQFIWKLNQEIEHTLKFIARVNEEKKAFEENEKFKRLLKNDIKIGDKIIGILDKVDFPELRIRLSVPVTEEQLQYATEILPDLTGEIEKDARLEDTIAKLEGNGKGLANPKIKDFIFDSEKARPLENPNILTPASKEWQEVKFHQNPKSNLNDSQIRGVLSSLNAEDLVIIQGPPGTGKSTAISEIIWHHIRTNSKQKILLTSESHLAVDNALDKLGTIPNGLVKPVRFGVDEDVFEETENQEESKIENEGKRYSYKRFKTWLESDKESTITETYNVLSDNAVQKWASLVGKKSMQQQETHQDIAHFLSDWNDILEKPEQDLKQLFYDNYMKSINVVGATSSSIALKNTKGNFTKTGQDWLSVFAAKDFEKYKTLVKTYKYFLRYDSDNKIEIEKYEKLIAKQLDVLNEKYPLKFDVIITDEASKATPPELALPMLYGKKNIVVGDHRQLPPSLDENDFTTTLKNIGTPESRELAKFFKDNTEELNISQFEKLFLGLSTNSSIRTTFNQQYRMHSSINKVIEQFYIQDGGLFCGLDPEKENIPNFSEPQSRWHGLEYPNFITPDTHCIWVNVDTPEVKDGTSRTNYGEIEACEKIIKILQNSKGFEEMQNYWKKEEDKEIGLISFYGTQVGKLLRMTQDKFPNLPIRVKTVDRFQGMERNLLIVSMVRSNKIANHPEQKPDFELYEDLGYPSQTSLGFAELPNRLNVALSRAKRLLIIVGNTTHFSQKDIYKNVYESIKNSPHGKIIDNIQDYNL